MAAIASGLANTALFVLDHGPAIGEHEAHGRHDELPPAWARMAIPDISLVLDRVSR